MSQSGRKSAAAIKRLAENTISYMNSTCREAMPGLAKKFYRQRANCIAVWNTTMDEHNYLVRRWMQLVGSRGDRGQ